MNNQIILQLKSIINETSTRGALDAETKRNILKEELQYYVLNFIYHHSEYSNWTMYGGSALRICHGLDRMSVDLDFEISEDINEEFIKNLKSEINDYFVKTYGIDSDFLTIKENNNRGVRLNFNVGKELGLGHTSDLVHIKVDLNCFTAEKTVTERIPINHNQFSFVIKTYNMSNLMSSKIAAIFLRGQRGVGNALYEEKGRDIYDLLWYMNKKIIPDLDYLKAKGIDISDMQSLFNKLTLKMNDVSYENLKNDLRPLFVDQNEIQDWLKNWMDTYLFLLNDYRINTISNLEKIKISQNLQTDDLLFVFWYKTIDDKPVKIFCNLSDYWLDKNIIDDNNDLDNLLEINKNMRRNDEKSIKELKKYAKLFKSKIESYLKKTNKVIIGDTMATKLIRMTADNLDHNEQIVLTPPALISCEFNDLLK
jgi:hypothetical protein